jgi:ribosomal protein S27E
LPKHVQAEFDAYLKCGRFEHGFLRVKCERCQAEKLVAFSCKGRAICPSCGARRMAECAALLVDEVLPERPLRQWVLSLPFALRFLLAREPDVLTQVLGIVYGEIARHIREKARLTRATGATGAVTLIQRFGSALNLNVHFHMLFLDGAYLLGTSPPVFRRIGAPSAAELAALLARIAERIGRALERTGWLQRDCETSYLALDPRAAGRWMTSWATRSRTGWRWDPAPGRRPSRCKRCRRGSGRKRAKALRARRASPCTRASASSRRPEGSSSDCAAT